VNQYEYRQKIYPKYTSQKMTNYVNISEDDYKQWGNIVSHNIRGWLPNNKDIECLDVACGVGQMLYFLKQSDYKRLTGIDISHEQVVASKKIWPNVLETNAIDFLKLYENKFDLITGFDIIEHLTKNEIFDFLEGLFRSLKPGGTLILQTPNAESPFGTMIRYGDLTHEIAFTPHSIKHILCVTGFKNIEFHECGPVAHGFKSFIRKGLWLILRSFIGVWNLVETGSKGSGIYTRIFIIKAEKQI
jgi:2-polyprenyl-3-methyl-5-hydroxy-6-metoxy-1,4-benzoquinol methylase